MTEEQKLIIQDHWITMVYCENCKKFEDQWENPIKDGELHKNCNMNELIERCGCEHKSKYNTYSVKGSILIKEEKNFVEDDSDKEDDDDDTFAFDPMVDFYTVKIFNKDGEFDRYWEDGIVYTNEDDAIAEYQLAVDSIQISSECETCSVILAFSHNTMDCKRFIDGVDIDVMSKKERKKNEAIINKLAI